MLSLFLASLTVLAPQTEDRAPRLVLEGRDGATREVDPRGFETTDPRDLGAWLVRPRGFGNGRPPRPSAGLQAELSLSGGDALRGVLAGGDGETLRLELLGGVQLPVSIESILGVRLPAHVPPGVLAPMVAPEEGDRIYRRAGRSLDAVDGTVESFTDEGVRFDSQELGLKTFAWTEVAALFVEFLGEEGGDGTEGSAPPVVVDLVDGSRVRGPLVRLDGTECRLSMGGSELGLLLSTVSEILVDDGSLRFLSDLEPRSEEGRGAPFGDDLGMVWAHRRDLNVLGRPLRSGGQIWRRGLGTHAPTRLTYDLGGAYGSLRGAVAIDDGVLSRGEEARGSVVFRILVDGESVFESGVIRGGDAPRVLPELNLTGAQALVLEADPAGDFAGDRANWLRLVLSGAEDSGR